MPQRPALFNKEKKEFLSKKDKSGKGRIDTGIGDIVSLINSRKDYYTTSSCSGRVVIISGGRKGRAGWLFTKHGSTNFRELKKSMENVPKSKVWLMFEPAILHVACRTTDNARELMKLMNRAGFKRTGIISISKRIVVEIMGSERIDAIIADNGNIIADDRYLKILADEANIKMERNMEMLKRLGELLGRLGE